MGITDISAWIRAASDVETLALRARGIPALGRDLVDAGVSAERVTGTVSALADCVSERAIQIVLRSEDLDGLDFCWLAFGSEGRREQTLCTDQDNGMVFDPGEGLRADEVRPRLVAIGRKVNEALDACGFSSCKGGIMAGNPSWCLSVDEWRKRFASWIEEPTPEALLHASIFFDFRPIYGNEALAAPMREQLVRSAPGNRRFLTLLVRNALVRRAPLGLFRDFAVENRGDHPGTIDLKCRAAGLFVDAARVYALSAGEGAVGTDERMRRAATAAGVDRREVEGWVDAFHFVQVIRLRHQLEQGRNGEIANNHIDPSALNPLERKFLRESLRQAVAIQKYLELTFCGETLRM
jgi:CBS domain-containing protein